MVVAIGSPSDDATFTLTEEDSDDRRAVTVASVPDALDELRERCRDGRRPPRSAATCCARIDDAGARVHRRHHRVARVLDAAVRTGVRALAGGAGTGCAGAHPGPGAGRTCRGHPLRAVQPGAAAQRVLDRRAGSTARGARGGPSRPVRDRGRAVGQRPVVLQRRRPGRVRHLRRSGQRPSGPHPAQPRTGARRTDRPTGQALPRRGARPGAGQRAGDGRLLRVGAVAAGRRLRPSGVEPGTDSRRRRHREHHPQDRSMANRLPGTERTDHRSADGTAVGPDRRVR